MTTIRLRTSKLYGSLVLVVAAIWGLNAMLSPSALRVTAAIICAALGVLLLFGTAFVFHLESSRAGESELKNPLGMTVRRDRFSDLSAVKIERSNLVISTVDGKRRKLGGWIASKSDMSALIYEVNSRR